MKNYTKLSLLTLLLATLLFASCKKEYDSIETIDDKAVKEYIVKNNLTSSMTKDASGYYYNIITPGTGAELKNSDSVYYSYTFKKLSGVVLNQTSELMVPGTFLGYTDQFTINGTAYLFKPLREVFSKLKRGGKATVILPSNLAFGKNGVSALNIGSNENIVVDLGIYTQSHRHEIDEYEINSFITKNSLTLTKDPSRAYYNITTLGTGTDAINVNSTIVAKYTVRYLDGTVLETSTDGTFTSQLSALYKGWQIILPGRVTAGGKLRLIIPADLGSNGLPLDFDIEIVSVTN